MILPWLIDAAYAGGLALGSPYLLFRMATSERFRAGFAQRLGRLPDLGDGASVWIHGASVGETMLSARLAAAVEEAACGRRVLVSVNTLQGHRVATARLAPDRVFYCPIDLHVVVERVLRRLRPACIVMVELEFWPNLWLAAARAGIPIVLANGRITERGRDRLAVLGPLCRAVFGRGVRNRYCVQNETYGKRLRTLGVPAERIVVTGNMKFDTVEVADAARRRAAARRLGLGDGELVFTCGSTHPGEEEAALAAWQAARQAGAPVRLVLAPRDPTRGDAVEKLVRAAGFGCARQSRDENATAGEVYLVDTVGELAAFYAVADCVFVGGSLIPHGGHNVVEPAAVGKPILFGPHMQNFAEEAAILRGCGGGRRVADAAELARAAETLLTDPEARAAMGAAAREAVEQSRGAVGRTLEAVTAALEDN